MGTLPYICCNFTNAVVIVNYFINVYGRVILNIFYDSHPRVKKVRTHLIHICVLATFVRINIQSLLEVTKTFQISVTWYACWHSIGNLKKKHKKMYLLNWYPMYIIKLLSYYWSLNYAHFKVKIFLLRIFNWLFYFYCTSPFIIPIFNITTMS